MYNSNRKFLNDHIDETNSFNLPDPKKLDIMAHFWSKSTKWPHPGRLQAIAIAYMHERRAREDQVTTLEQVRTLVTPTWMGSKDLVCGLRPTSHVP